MNKHDLKILPAYFDAVLDGSKTFEIRDNRDRGFQKGDLVVLRELDVGVGYQRYSGREITKQITYVTNYEQKDGFVVFAMTDVEGVAV